MATLYVTEYNALTFDNFGRVVAAPVNPPIAEQAVAIVNGSSVQSAPFTSQTLFVMLNCDVACSLAWGANPIATKSAQRMAQNETRFYGVPVTATQGVPQMVAVIMNS